MRVGSDWQYRAMMYAAVATLHFYRKDFVPPAEGDNDGKLYDKNKALAERVREEVKNLFGYEISNTQLAKALWAYAADPIGVADRPTATIQELRNAA